MTELQMALHEHPVNLARERSGLPTANAVWLWGLGSLAPNDVQTARTLPAGWSDDAFTRGLYRAHGAELEQLAPSQSILAKTQSRTALAVAPVADSQQLQSEWVDPLIRALGSHQIDGLELILDQWRLQADRAALRRFWRRPLSVSGWEQHA